MGSPKELDVLPPCSPKGLDTPSMGSPKGLDYGEDHSAFKADRGFTAVARRAGTRQPISETARRNTRHAAKGRGSRGLMPYNKPETVDARA